MSEKAAHRALVLVVSLLGATAAHADLAGAQKAYAAKDFEGAFQQYLEIATLGNLTAQENLAAMYVDGEGVKRDNVLGYAWAVIARENGGNVAMQNIIDQLQPHLDDKAKSRVKAVIDQYGKAALQERLLPAPRDPKATQSANTCRFTKPANPEDSYPEEAVRHGISGSVVVEATVGADGRAHHPLVLYSIPEIVLDNAARVNGFANVFAAPKKDGVIVPCSIRYKVKYRPISSGADSAMNDALVKAKRIAEAGDPVAQTVYGLLLLDRAPPGPDAVPPRDWFLEAAKAGVPFAQYVVGIGLVAEGTTLPESEQVKGFAWLKLAAAAGEPHAKFALANYTLAHDKDASSDPVVFAWLEDATKADHRDATLTLAALLAAGPDASRRDAARALTLLDKSKWGFGFDPTAQEVIAAANAQLKNFVVAVDAQKRAIGLARQYGWDLAPLQERLAKYDAKGTWTGNLMSP